MDNKHIMDELESLKKIGANILLPSERIEILSEFHSPVLEKVSLNSDPNYGDVYPAGYTDQIKKNGPYRITKQGLSKLANCANVAWDANKTGVVERDANYVLFQAVGGIKGADGMLSRPMVAHYPVDLIVVKEDIIERTNSKAEKASWLKTPAQKQAYIKQTIEKDFRFERHHALKKAESGAKNRVTRDLLNLKGQYTKQELQQPFVILRYEFKPDYSDPFTKKLMLASFAQGMGLFSQQPQIAAPQVFEAETIDLQPVDKIHHPEEKRQPEPPPQNTNDFDEYESAEIDFQSLSEEEQVQTLEKLIVEKKYEVTFKSPLTSFQPHQRVNFFRTLIRMENK